MKPALVSSRLLKKAGVKHGFSERGIKGEGTFGALNVKSDAATPDDPDRAQHNRQTILQAGGVDAERAVFLRTLAHGNTVFEAHASDVGHEIDGYDSIVTNQRLAIGLSVADCVPILLYDPVRNAAAVVHAGWRSTVASVVHETLKALHRFYGSQAKDLLSVIGPSICGNCYEVGDEVADLFDEAFIHETGNRTTADIRAANISQLRIGGVEQIDDIDLCTYELSDRFFSVRKEGQTGRFLAFIETKK